VLLGGVGLFWFDGSDDIRIPAGRHTTVGAWWSAVRGLPWRGPLERIVTIQSRPEAVEVGWTPTVGGVGCAGDTSKLLGRTRGGAVPRGRSLRVGVRGERAGESATLTGRWEWMLLVHDGPNSLAANAFEVAPLGLTTAPGAQVRVRLQPAPGDSTAIHLAVLNGAANETRTHTVAVPLGWGIPLPLYVGGQCPAAADLLVAISPPASG
jgi:hypothetical protein